MLPAVGMASLPLLDFEALIGPIPGDDPAGGPLPYQVRSALEDARKEIDPNDYDPNDPRRPEEAKKADWTGVVRLAQEALTRTTKDLTLAARLTEALAQLHGFAGLRDGLHLLRLLIEQCWDRLSPSLEDGDPDIRSAPFLWLDDQDRGALFPSTLRGVPLTGPSGGRYGWLDWRQSQKEHGSVSRETFEKAVLTTSHEECAATINDLSQAQDELALLAEALNSKIGPGAPSLLGLREALTDCRALAEQILQRTFSAAPILESPGPATVAEPGSPIASGTPLSARPLTTRAQVYRQLAEAASALQQLEPHSPIPYLIQRAVELGALPFPQLMRELIRDSKVLEDLNRELGIKEPPPEG